MQLTVAKQGGFSSRTWPTKKPASPSRGMLAFRNSTQKPSNQFGTYSLNFIFQTIASKDQKG